MSVQEPNTQVSFGESMLLATQADPISDPSLSTSVPAPTASKFGRDLDELRVAELMTIREGPNTTHLSQPLDTVLPSQDPEVVLPHVSA